MTLSNKSLRHTLREFQRAFADYQHHRDAAENLRKHVIYQRRRLELTAEMIRLEGGTCELPPLPLCMQTQSAQRAAKVAAQATERR